MKTICIDAGHGGKDPGACAGGVREKDIALDVAKKIRAHLQAVGYGVILTREQDKFVSLGNRAAEANMWGADLFVSVHCNSAPNSSANGMEVYVHTSRGADSTRAAHAIYDRLLPASGLRGRGVKSKDLAVLRETDIDSAGRLIWNGEVLTSEILRGEIDLEMVKLGMLPTGTICAGGEQGSQPHNVGSGPLFANRPIVMDIFPRSAETGYWGDLTRTVVRGRAPEIVRKAYDAVLAARELGKSLIAVGADPAEIHRAAAASMEKAGFRTGQNEKSAFGFFHGLGHGVGLDIHESPRLSPRNANPLRGGEVVTVEPGLYYPEWGGIRLEDLVYLSPGNGPQCLTELEDFLEL